MATKGIFGLAHIFRSTFAISHINYYLLFGFILNVTAAHINLFNNIDSTIMPAPLPAAIKSSNFFGFKNDYSGSFSKCSISEFKCDNNKCINTNEYCNQVNDCGDNSDEPRHCTRKYL